MALTEEDFNKIPVAVTEDLFAKIPVLGQDVDLDESSFESIPLLDDVGTAASAGAKSGATNFNQTLLNLFQGSPIGLMERGASGLAEAVTGREPITAASTLESLISQGQPSAEEERAVNRNLLTKVVSGATEAATSLPAYATVAGAGPAGFAALGASGRAHEGLLPAAQGGLEGFLMGKSFGAAGQLPKPLAALGLGGQGAATTAATQYATTGEVNPTDVASSGILGAGMGALAGKRGTKEPTASTPSGDVPVKTAVYLEELVAKQEAARQKAQSNLGMLYRDAKTKLVDYTAPIKDVVAKSQKEGKYEILPKYDIADKIDMVHRAPGLATQFFKDSGFESLIKETPDVEAFGQYLIAKRAKQVSGRDIKTGRDPVKDEQLIKDLAPVYEPLAIKFNEANQKLIDYLEKTELVSPETATKMRQEPVYAPLNRIFGEGELTPGPGGSKATASLSKQTVVQKLKGSEREIENPLYSMAEKINQAHIEGQRNLAAKTLIDLHEMPGIKDLLKPAEGTATGKHTITYLNKGVKEVWETTPEIAAAAKGLNVQQLETLARVVAFPVRVARIGITGLNPAFLLPNLVKDQGTAIINSPSLRTTIANPPVFLKSLFESLKHGKVYEEMQRNAALQTSYDLSRNQSRQTLERIISTKSKLGAIKYTVRHPGELLRVLENIAGRSEELTRIQQYVGIKEKLLREGRTEQDATILARKAARETTANFMNRGEWGPAMNAALLYLNAGIQGSRAFIRAASERPIQTAAKVATGFLFPAAAITAWNMVDPQRRKVYQDIRGHEKGSNLIVVMDGARLGEDGRYDNVIKIPLPQSVDNLMGVVRQGIETTFEMDPPAAMDIANALIGTVSPVVPQWTGNDSVMSTLIPQQIKPAVEVTANYDFFKEKPIVPGPLERLPDAKQAYPWTPESYRWAGEKAGVSPIKLEHLVKGYGGSLATQLTGGRGPLDSIMARFYGAQGGEVRAKKMKKAKEQARGR